MGVLKISLAVYLLLLNSVSAGEYYNILTIDGGGIRGLIPAMILKEMETYGFTYATSKGYTVP